MLVNFTDILKKADKERYAIGAFNMTSLESALAIVQAAEAEDSPAILQISEKTIDYMGLELAFVIAKTVIEQSKMPIAIHFDHGRNFPLVRQAVELGFSSAMLDVSKMPEKERIPFVKEFVDFAHHRNVTVEAEETMIGGREDYIEGDNWQFTEPKRAATFVKETGVDCFAVSIGSSHGKPLPNETLHMDLLSEIDRAVDVPLVLHGASSTPENLIREVISRGICKINIDTDLRLVFTKTIRDTLKDEVIYDPRDILRPSIEGMRGMVQEKMRLFGSSHKA